MTLYRTYRPTRFNQIVGQETAAKILQSSLAKNRVAHAYLFSGPRGTGKTSTARIFTSALCCLSPIIKNDTSTVNYEACGTCTACLLLAGNQGTDFIEIDAASNRGIEDIRQLREQVSYPPSQLKRKVYLIDEVHMLTNDAFNALLKTLEEPPEHCLFILATTELHKVPLTIRSRCQLIRFERGSVASITEKLNHIVSQEKLEVGKGVTALIAEHADGGYRDAETLLESLTALHPSLTLEQAEQALGILPEKSVQQLVDALLQQDLAATLNVVQHSIVPSINSYEGLLQQIISELRQRLYAETTSNDRRGLIGLALEQFLEAYLLLKNSPVPSLTLEIACTTVCGFGQTLAPLQASQEVIPRSSSLVTQPLTITPESVVSDQSVPVVELREKSDEPIKDVRRAWKTMIDTVSTGNLVLAQIIKDTIIHTVEGPVITVHVRFRFHADKLNESHNRTLIAKHLLDLTGKEWQINYHVTQATAKRPSGKSIGDGLAEAKAVFGG